MTDTRLPDKWLLNPTLDSLSDGAWRVWTRALIWCNQQGTDGDIPSLYLRYIYPWSDPSEYLLELLNIGWLEETENGFAIPDWEGKGQSLAAYVTARRETNRLRQQNLRAKKKSSQGESVTNDVTRDIGQERTGQDRTGQDNYKSETWPEVRKPGESERSQ
jgi:hypothetical protein